VVDGVDFAEDAEGFWIEAETAEDVGLETGEGAAAGAEVVGHLLTAHFRGLLGEPSGAESEAAQTGIHSSPLDPCVGESLSELVIVIVIVEIHSHLPFLRLANWGCCFSQAFQRASKPGLLRSPERTRCK
jgi:hypothetical protein